MTQNRNALDTGGGAQRLTWGWNAPGAVPG